MQLAVADAVKLRYSHLRFFVPKSLYAFLNRIHSFDELPNHTVNYANMCVCDSKHELKLGLLPL